MNKSELKKLIESAVRQELSKVLPVMVPQVIKEVMATLILETDVSATMPVSRTSKSVGNSYKRAALSETRSMIDEPSDDGSWRGVDTINREPVKKPFGFSINGKMIPMDTMVDDNGNVIPIRAGALNENTIRALDDAFSGKAAEIYRKIANKRVGEIDLNSPIG